MLLLHGTKPEVVEAILEESVDPDLSHPGLFGRSSYLVEHSAKEDQYATVDREWQGAKGEFSSQRLTALHHKLYLSASLIGQAARAQGKA